MLQHRADKAGPAAGEKAAFWDGRIAAWEASRYSPLSLFNPLSWTVRNRLKAARRLVSGKFKHHPHILDLGCGSGLLAGALPGDPGRSYLGVDFSRAAIEAARARFAGQADRIRFERADVLEGPGREAPLIVFLGLLDWLEEPEPDLLFGKLKAENLVFSFTEADSGLAGRLYRQYRRCSDGKYSARNFTAARITAAAEAAGYRIDRITRFSFFDPGRLVEASKR
jgi:SAM-dependent methyltransferase